MPHGCRESGGSKTNSQPMVDARFLSLILAIAACASASPPVADPGTYSLICFLVPANMPRLVRFLSTAGLKNLPWLEKNGIEGGREAGGGKRTAYPYHSACCRTFNPHQVAGRGEPSALGRCQAPSMETDLLESSTRGSPPASTLGCFSRGLDVRTTVQVTAKSGH